MITLKTDGMDEHSADIMRDSRHIGYLQWHDGEQPRVVLCFAFEHLTLYEMREILNKWERGEHRQ